jgi:hypothetical protein
MRAATQQPGATRLKQRYGQRGAAMPLVVVGLLAMLAVAGLALDSSHALANKTRLQNLVDAAALTAAKEVSLTADTAQATAAAMSLFGQNADGAGNHEVDDAWDAGEGEITLTVQYSATLNPFVPGAPEGPYVRVIAQNFNIGTSLSRVLGIDQIAVAASAVSGPSATLDNACNVAPLVVCADEPDQADFGFQQNELRVLKPGEHDEVGPGNYKLLRLDCGPGGACVRQNMAGSYDQCLSDAETVETEPGVTAGPTSQGFNTRFGQYNGGDVNPQEYPPDVVVRTPDPYLKTDDSEPPKILYGTQDVQTTDQIDGFFYGYTEYEADLGNPSSQQYPPPLGVPRRRVMAMPVANCTGDQTGQSTLQVKGFACFFMLQPIILGGPDTDKNKIFGQFVEECMATGVPGPAPGDEGPTFVIQLYDDPDSDDS